MTETTPRGWGELPIARMVKAAWNYKGEDEDKAAKLRANIEKNGVIENIIVRELTDGALEVVNGNHRLDAFLALGVDSVMCFNLGTVSDRVAKRVAIETNETRFPTDHLRLAEEMQDLLAEFDVNDLAATMPYSTEEIEGMVDLLDYDWTAAADPGAQEPPTSTQHVVECPACGHSFNTTKS